MNTLANVRRSWTQFWFAPTQPIALHVIRMAAGALFLFWLLPFAGQIKAMFGMQGWLDLQAYEELVRLTDSPIMLNWSLVYLFANNQDMLDWLYWGTIVVLALFTLGVATRVTAILTWVMMTSFTVNPAIYFEADCILHILAFYLMIGYVFLDLARPDLSLAERILGARTCFLWGKPTAANSSAPTTALRLLQVHTAILITVSGLHKLQFGEWWAGFALWYPLFPPVASSTMDQALRFREYGTLLMCVLSIATYAVLAWQLAFPFFAWKRAFRPLLIGGGLIYWIGASFFFDVPLFGPGIFALCLAFLTDEEWSRLLTFVGIWGRAEPVRAADTVKNETRKPMASAARLVSVLALASVFAMSCAPVAVPPSPTEQGPKPIDTEPIKGEVQDIVKKRVEMAIEQVRNRELTTSNGFWTVFHGILGLGPTVPLRNQDTGDKIGALDYIGNGGRLRGLQFIPTRHGLDVTMGPTYVGQGHQDQFIAEMAQWGIPRDYRFSVEGRDYTYLDFLQQSKARARTDKAANQELSWAIVVIPQYFGPDHAWTNAFGEKLTVEDLLRYEVDASVETAACGGTHRLFGITWAFHIHLLHGGKLEGIWSEVPEKIKHHRDLARKYQNRDGSLSTNFFKEPGNSTDPQARIYATGHMLEWLALALSDEDIRQPWVQDTANALALMILEIEASPMEGGALYHAVHGLLLYYARLYDRSALGANNPLLPLIDGLDALQRFPGAEDLPLPTPQPRMQPVDDPNE